MISSNTPFKSLQRAVGAFPVLSFRGPLKGSWWSAYPQSSYWRGTFEPILTTEVLQQLPGSGGCCWHLGAHFGYYSALMAMQVGKIGQVVSLEPNPASYQRLKRHCRWNQFSQILPFPLAASDKKACSELINYSHPWDTSAHLAYPHEARSTTASYLKIETIRMEDFAGEQGLRMPDFIKIDVEGHGSEALRGCGSILINHRPTCIVSVHTQEEYEGLLSQFCTAKYSFLSLPAASPAACPWPGDYLAVPMKLRSGHLD